MCVSNTFFRALRQPGGSIAKAQDQGLIQFAYSTSNSWGLMERPRSLTRSGGPFYRPQNC
jgi:hypothetical protein